MAEQLVHGHVDERRAAVRHLGQAQRLVDRGVDVGGGASGDSGLGDGPEQGRVVQLLQRARPPAEGWGATTHDQQGHPGGLCLCHCADRVGDPGTCGHRGEPRPTGELGGRFGGEHGRLLVPDVHHAHASLRRRGGVVQREDMRPGEREQGVDTVGLGGAERQRAGMDGGGRIGGVDGR